MEKIKVTVDTAHAFDMLSILTIKGAPCKTLCKEIYDQIGLRHFLIVTESKEYKELLTANEELFVAVNRAKLNEITASEFDNLNRIRFTKKSELQTKFFGGMTEQKIWKN